MIVSLIQTWTTLAAPRGPGERPGPPHVGPLPAAWREPPLWPDSAGWGPATAGFSKSEAHRTAAPQLTVQESGPDPQAMWLAHLAKGRDTSNEPRRFWWTVTVDRGEEQPEVSSK